MPRQKKYNSEEEKKIKDEHSLAKEALEIEIESLDIILSLTKSVNSLKSIIVRLFLVFGFYE